MSSVGGVQTMASVAEELRPVCERFVSAGYRIYLVGGAVRDLLLEDRDAVDFDLTTDASPVQTKKLVKPLASALWTQGERFGTIGCIIDGRDYEITTHRGESYNSDSRKPTVEFSNDVEVDLSRRDFTVNAMAISLPDLEFVDPFGGRDDLEARVLRTPLSPQISFTDDPLRMLRAARFMAGYGLTPVPELVAAMSEFADRLTIVSSERIRDEVMKLLLLKDPVPGLELMVSTGVLQQFLPEVAQSEDQAQLFASVRAASNQLVRLAVLLHREDVDVGVARMKAMRAPNQEVRLVAVLNGLVQYFLTTEIDDETVRRMCFAGGSEMALLLEFWEALGTSDAALISSFALFQTRYQELRMTEDLVDFSPPLDGEQIMKILDVQAGKIIGDATKLLIERRLIDGPVNVAQAESLLRAEFG